MLESVRWVGSPSSKRSVSLGEEMVVSQLNSFKEIFFHGFLLCFVAVGLAACSSSGEDQGAAQSSDITPKAGEQKAQKVNEVSKASLSFLGEANASLPDGVTAEEAANIAYSFKSAIEKSKSNQLDGAQAIYQSIIDTHPQVIESYLNLAAIYADKGELEKATQIINRGVANNPRSAVVFEALKKLNGAAAANAYRSALNEGERIEKVHISSLASLSQSSLDEVERARLDGFQERLNKINNFYANQLMQARRGEINKQKEVQGLQQQLQSAQGQISELRGSSNLALQNTRAELEQEVAAIKQQAETDLKDRARTVGNLNMELITLRKELEQTQVQLAALTTENQQLMTDVKRANELASIAPVEVAAVTPRDTELIASRISPVEQNADAVVSSDVVSIDQSDTPEIASSQVAKIVESETAVSSDPVSRVDAQPSFDTEAAKELVRSWARAWSDQNVQAYVGHYQANYKPKRKKISHNQWKQQRKVRLTNKRFVEVKVADFEVKDLGNTFTVTFSQHYRSDNLDDKIVKRLEFAKTPVNTRNAKIIDELVL